MTAAFSPPFTPPDRLAATLRQDGYAVLSPQGVADWVSAPLAQLEALHADWDHLPLDEYLKDGGRYRKRRHACFIDEGGKLAQSPHRAHWQPIEYNALHGGMRRLFEPVEPATVAQPAWTQLLTALGAVCSSVRGAHTWSVEAHQFRIDTADGIGRPTPEGAHRDGVDFVAVILIAREGIKGGETRVFDAHGPRGQRFTMEEPWTLLLLDDAAVIHESTPIQPLAGAASGGHRDTLVLTWRAGGFQGDGVQAEE